jgi:glycosyltransferase involved in cell wall biosynthesis
MNRPTRIAYLVNQYPQPSLTFVRREVRELEASGLPIDRYSIRPPPSDLVDADDRIEADRTTALLTGGGLGKLGRLVTATLGNALRSPVATLRTLKLALRISRGSDRGLIRHLAYAAEACLLRKLLDRTGATHLHAHFATNSAAVAMLCHVAGGPGYSFTVHGQKGLDLPGPISLREKVRRAAFVVCISDFGRSSVMLRSDPGDWPRIHVIRCGLGSDLLEAAVPALPDGPRVVCVGRLAVEKGHVLLLDAVAMLRDRGVAIDLTLVGDGPMRPTIEAKVRDLDLADRVRLVGTADAAGVRGHLARARLLVMQSFIEGLPVVIMEAFAMGRPVVVPGIAGIPELVKPGESGWLFPPGNVTALADALSTALRTDRAVLSRMGEVGRAAVRECHDAKTNAHRLRTLFEHAGNT